ncbi:MAG: cytochrome c [Gammaproteobacteria bacterium]|nr:cytochrome c [Gammaproteobacteria bacterium]MDH5512540.1 cytochrome c [Gammaproteobacteria bacterium]
MQRFNNIIFSKFVFATSLAAFFLMGATAAHAKNISRPGGENTASCEQCHGPKGAAPVQGLIPKLCGQNREYLEAALLQFQDGRRPQPIMHATTNTLSKDVIKQLAAYFANASCSEK